MEYNLIQGRILGFLNITCRYIDKRWKRLKYLMFEGDATTDGDHITKEHTRIKATAEAGYIPIRVMFYYPNRAQAIRIQGTLETLYNGIGGQYYYGDAAWEYVERRTGITLKAILEKLAEENTASYG